MDRNEIFGLIGRYFHTAKHLQGRQIATRLKKLSPLHNLFFPSEFKPSGCEGRTQETFFAPSLPVLKARSDKQSALKSAEKVISGVFDFNGKKEEYGDEIKWSDSSKSRLWRFNLQYFAYLLDLAYSYKETGNERFLRRLEKLIKDWVDKNGEVGGDAWHPYVISRRVVNWIYAYRFAEADIGKEVKCLLLESLGFQLEFLRRNLEIDLLANHLFSDARALYIGGSFLGKERLERKGSKILASQLEEQILSDGGHFERSPSYHCQVLIDLLDCLSWTSREEELYERLREKASDMLGFLSVIILPSGNIPLMSDSTLNGAPQPDLIFNYAKELGIEYSRGEYEKVRKLHDSGYFIIESGEQSMIIDGGKIGPDYQPGHGHCDMFNYELVLDERKFITDSGNYEYEEGEMRDYCRGTAAHNTVMVDGEEQSEIWKSFRVARRAQPKNVTLGLKGSMPCFSGEHDGYRRLGSGVFHKRKICLVDDSFWLIFDRIAGRGRHRAESFIHFHPEVTISDKLVADWGNSKIHVLPFGVDIVKRDTSYYCPEFGEKIERDMVKLKKEGKVPLHFGYLLLPNVESARIVDFEFNSGKDFSLSLIIDDNVFSVKVGEDGISMEN